MKSFLPTRRPPAEDSQISSQTDERSVKHLVHFFKAYIKTKHTDVLLLTCCFISGTVDSSLYNEYGTFVSMQTGNTIFVGLGASGQNLRPYGWARSLTSIGCFSIGCLTFARTGLLLGPRRRGSLALSFFLQACLITVAAGLFQGGAISRVAAVMGSKVHWNQEVAIVLLSFQAAGQIVTSRALGFNEVPTVVITSLLCDLMSDPRLLVWRNEKRDRRILAFILTLVGAIFGGWISKLTGGISAVLWIVVGLKLSIACAWLFWAVDPTTAA